MHTLREFIVGHYVALGNVVERESALHECLSNSGDGLGYPWVVWQHLLLEHQLEASDKVREGHLRLKEQRL